MKKVILIILLFISLISLNACKKDLINDKEDYEVIELTHEVSTFEKMDGKDEVYGRKKVVEKFYVNPKKVVSFSLGVADTLNKFNVEELGIEIFGIPKDQQKLPNMLEVFNDKKYPDVGTLFVPDFNVIELINPDLIILDGRSAKYYEQIKKDYPYINVLDTSLTTYDILTQEEIFVNLGKIFPKIKDELDNYINYFKQSFNEISLVSKNHSAIFLQLNGKTLSAATNKLGRYGLIYNEFGFKFNKITNVENENQHGSAEISIENILETNPDVIFIMDRNIIVEDKKSDRSFLNEPTIKNVNAIKDGYIYDLHPESWYTITGGINATSQMIEDINTFINK